MAIGFGKTTTSESNIIKSMEKSFLANSKLVDLQRREWDEHCANTKLPQFSREELFTSNEYSYQGVDCLQNLIGNPNISTSSLPDFIRVYEVITLGHWRIRVSKDLRGNYSKKFPKWDFTLSVFCGNAFVYHPKAARNNIVRYHGISTYEKWKHVVLGELEDFAKVIAAYNPPANMRSYTCSSSSERICKRLGLRVRNKIAYLTHRKGEPCQHKLGTFIAPVL